MYAVGDTHSHMFPVGDGGVEEDLSHVRSGGRSVTHVPSGGWWRRGGSQPYTQWGMLSDTFTQWGMGGERRISVMYVVGDVFRDLISSHFPTVNTLYVFTNN